MPTFYFETDLRNTFSAPQLTRLRHRYRGVRESWKINLEINQMLFAITDLYEKYNDMHATFIANRELLIEGGPSGVNDSNDDPIVLEGLNDLILRVTDLQARVKRLEK